MIEQTPMDVTEWIYHSPANPSEDGEKLTRHIDFDVMGKRISTKKGIACRFSLVYNKDNATVLSLVGEDSYVIDLDDYIDKNELRTMINNSYSKFNDIFELKKLDTIFHSNFLPPMDESMIDYEMILPLLL